MKTMIDIKELYSFKTTPILTNTYIFVKHCDSDKKFLFEVPDGLQINFGDTVLCDTIKGEVRGLAASMPFELDRQSANVLSDVLGFYFPIKQIVAKLILPENNEVPF